MISRRAMSLVRWAQALGGSFLCQQPFGEVHTLLELAEPALHVVERLRDAREVGVGESPSGALVRASDQPSQDRKSTRLNSSHTVISYAVFCLKKKKIKRSLDTPRGAILNSAWR